MSWEKDEARWAQMMQQAQQGDSKVYQQLLGELSTVAERFLKAKFGNYAFIEDCVQECLISIHNARHTYAPEHPFRPWFFAIVKHKAIDFLRASNRNQARHSDVDLDTIKDDSQKETLEDRIAQSQLLKGLKTEYQEMIVLGKFLGYSVQELADHLNMSQSAVKVRMHRAVKALKQQFKGEHKGEQYE